MRVRLPAVPAVILPACLLFVSLACAARAETYPVVDTGQSACYGMRTEISCPGSGRDFSGQDAQYRGHAPAYRDNGDGTVTDMVTGLTWSKGVDGRKVTPEEAARIAASMTLGGHSDWRVPTIKELYSLIDFRGYTGSVRPESGTGAPPNAVPFIDTDHFDFTWGDTEAGERYIDAQWVTGTIYTSTTMGGQRTMFGVNFADGRIKGYGYAFGNRINKNFFARYVRGPAYGVNDFTDNGDGSVADRATGLTWARADSARGMKWEDALAYCEGLSLAGHDDWRLPNAKELQSIVDYSRSPDATGSAAMDPVFQCTPITNEAGQRDYGFYWTSTTHLDGPRPGDRAAYVSFGRAMGQMRGRTMDVHGAGAQRSDPKTGPAMLGQGPQGDAQRVLNLARCVRGGAVRAATKAAPGGAYPNKIRVTQVRVPNSLHGPGGHSQGRSQGMGQGSQRMLGPGQGMGGQQGGQGYGQMPQGGQMQQGGQGYGQMPQGGQQGPPPGGGAGFIQHLDRDGDGKVSRREFDGPPDRFDFHDADHDGYISADEAPQGPPPGMGPGMGQGMGQ